MGFTSKTLPKERKNFFGGKFLAINGINRYEWYPTEEEHELVTAAMRESPLAWDTSTEDGVSLERAFYYWLTEHFTDSRFTDDYSNPVTSEMVQAALGEFEKSLA